VLLFTPGFYPDQLLLWPRCWTEGSTPELRDDLTSGGDFIVNWQDLARVAAFLRSKGVRDRELACVGGWTHSLYQELGLEPPTRYPQVIQLLYFFPSRAEQVRSELEASPVRYVVSDLANLRLTFREIHETAPGKGPSLPPGFPRHEFATVFPWYEPLVFRSGRYVVHRVTRPITKLWLREWDWAEVVDPNTSLKAP
jgi:hypothetical protein